MSVVHAVVSAAGDSYHNSPTLEALLPVLVTSEQANKLFDLMPGMEYCTYNQSSGLLQSCALNRILNGF